MNNNLKCLIVDDEVAAHYVLQDYIQKLDYLQLEGQCYNGIEAINFLHKNTVDLVSLDITMPQISGLEFLKTLSNPPKVILTTAYKEFAIEGFEYGVADYLLKPISFQRFAKATDRVFEMLHQKVNFRHNPIDDFIFLKVDRENLKVALDDIYYIQSEGNYARVYFKDKTFLATTSTSELENSLPSYLFLRVHKSYIISINRIQSFDNKSLIILDNHIPIGITFRREFLERIR